MKISTTTSQAVIDGLLEAISQAKRQGDTKLASQLQNGLIEHMKSMLEIRQDLDSLQ